ncbi:MAG: hypothetical protein ISR96_06530 [Nitrospira sp.]|nr:hypothetical protein [bacterium]MBL7049150.1 hypothetical protein [Nitrospira sp.]
MKKILIITGIISVLAMGTLAVAHGPGSGWGGGHMSGPGYGQHGMGAGHGQPGMGQGMINTPENQKAFEETTALRREMHEKKFEYNEARRNPKATNEEIAKLESEVKEMHEKISGKFPQMRIGRNGGYGSCQ